MNKILSVVICLNIYFFQYANTIIIFSIPKCGTHLLAKCIDLLTNKKLAYELNFKNVQKNSLPVANNNEFFRCHMPYSKKIHQEIENKKHKVFFIYRDPRDQIVSRAYWLQERFKKIYSNQMELNDNFDFPKCILPFLNCVKNGFIPEKKSLIDLLIQDINRCYDRFLKWKDVKDICVIKFENLIGPIGGGKLEVQIKEIEKICDFLNIKEQSLIDNCIKNLFGNTYTFRKGEIGSWKSEFDNNQKEKFKEFANDLLLNLTYEQTLDW